MSQWPSMQRRIFRHSHGSPRAKGHKTRAQILPINNTHCNAIMNLLETGRYPTKMFVDSQINIYFKQLDIHLTNENEVLDMTSNMHMTTGWFPIFNCSVSFHYTIVDITHACIQPAPDHHVHWSSFPSEVWSPKKDMRTAACGLCACGELGPGNQESITNQK